MKKTADIIDEYIATLPTIELPAKSVIFRQGDEGMQAYIVADGEAIVCSHNRKGDLVHLTTLRKGQMFGELALFSHGQRTATVITETGCRLVVIQRQDLNRKLLAADPFIRFWIEYLSGRVISLTSRVDGSLGPPAEG
jgi:CRP/FNR family transcriptional regulator, cyclic AMP receptor protein